MSAPAAQSGAVAARPAFRDVAVIGGGTMGNGIAQVFATSGYDVRLVDVSPAFVDRALGTIGRNLERVAKKQEWPAERVPEILGRVRGGTDLEAVKGCALVIEAANEDLAVKRDLFARLDALAAPGAILASNTSSISITTLAAGTKRPGQVIGMHFMNPVPVMTLVEVIRGLATTDSTCATVMDTVACLGKTAVEVNDYPGFVSNRILMPMINEACFALMEGVASREAIDTVMKLGMNHPMGPLALADLIGLDVCLSILEVLHQGLGDPKYRACPLLRKMVAAGHLGRKSGRGFYEYPETTPKKG